ncbi:hypothetical protein PWG15_05375 [Ensifer adhaerens]|uniref:hypothetical protein n=1 Tax=Ensifer adhaerens TaxID=106592 RepID=UPI0023A93CE3|nr:hypothetical protein [Ensifer adhaerens]WDZ77935.1 hypothetical protein PWG15_05375 [Ensifer adhaerens]
MGKLREAAGRMVDQMEAHSGGDRRREAAKARLQHHAAEAEVAREELRRSTQPFLTGDLVELKSGGFQMMVEGVDQRCGEDYWTVHLVWNTFIDRAEISRDSLPSSCLQLVPIVDGRFRPTRSSRDLDTDIPF